MENKERISDIYKKIHFYSFANEKILREQIDCVCIYCGKKMEYASISYWIKDRKGKTALCPNCCVDCVVPKAMNGVYELNDDMILEMHKLYFG